MIERPIHSFRALARSLVGLLLVGSLAAAAASPSGTSALQGGRQVMKPATFITCTPKTIELMGEPMREVRNPIAEALAVAGPGSTIRLRAGDYPAFGIGYKKPAHWNARTSGGLPGRPILVQAQGPVRIQPGDQGDTLSIDQGVRNGHITFEGITFVPGYRAAIFFTKQSKGSHAGYRFFDCDILGTWDHLANRGGKSKWGVWGHSLADFEFRGVRRPARVESLRYEHGFYLQNAKGDITIDNVHASKLGRTFIQITNRTHDGDAGRGTILVKNCVVSDVGISRDDNFKGGSAFTFAGRHQGTILLEGNTYRCGFDAGLKTLTKKGVPYGTGGLVFWDGSQKIPSKRAILRNNTFEFAPGCGDRPVASFGAVQDLQILGGNKFVAGGEEMAFVLEPAENGVGGRLGKITITEGNEIQGRIVRGRERLEPEDLKQFAAPVGTKRQQPGGRRPGRGGE